MSFTKMKPSRNKKAKYLTYKEAFTRINQAIDAHFFLEAITIEESIICDRMISYLHGKFGVAFSENDMKSVKTLTGSLLKMWRKHAPEPIAFKNYLDLHKEIDEWREQRNYLLHSMTKSYPGKPTKNINDFLDDACIAAIRGKKLARALSDIAKEGNKKR
ncbi:MAG: hypothetical protein WBN66_03320 [Smithella sp.]